MVLERHLWIKYIYKRKFFLLYTLWYYKYSTWKLEFRFFTVLHEFWRKEFTNPQTLPGVIKNPIVGVQNIEDNTWCSALARFSSYCNIVSQVFLTNTVWLVCLVRLKNSYLLVRVREVLIWVRKESTTSMKWFDSCMSFISVAHFRC